MLAVSAGWADWSQAVGGLGDEEKVVVALRWVKKGDFADGEGWITGGGRGRRSEEFFAEAVERVIMDDMVRSTVDGTGPTDRRCGTEGSVDEEGVQAGREGGCFWAREGSVRRGGALVFPFLFRSVSCLTTDEMESGE